MCFFYPWVFETLGRGRKPLVITVEEIVLVLVLVFVRVLVLELLVRVPIACVTESTVLHFYRSRLTSPSFMNVPPVIIFQSSPLVAMLSFVCNPFFFLQSYSFFAITTFNCNHTL